MIVTNGMMGGGGGVINSSGNNDDDSNRSYGIGQQGRASFNRPNKPRMMSNANRVKRQILYTKNPCSIRIISFTNFTYLLTLLNASVGPLSCVDDSKRSLHLVGHIALKNFPMCCNNRSLPHPKEGVLNKPPVYYNILGACLASICRMH